MRGFVGVAVVVWGLLGGRAAGAERVPGEVLGLSGWKLTLPVDRDGDGQADEVRWPALGTFRDAERFFVEEAGEGVVFRAECGGATTKGSKYPRCELREMRGEERASWGTDDGGVHAMTATLAITRTPAVKRHVVCAQIHDADDDLLMIRLEGKKLLVERNAAGDVVLDADYTLETPFVIRIEAAEGRVKVWYDGVPKLDWKVARRGCYFKAGCYTQSNVGKGDAAGSYGEVVIRRLEVSHRGE